MWLDLTTCKIHRRTPTADQRKSQNPAFLVNGLLGKAGTKPASKNNVSLQPQDLDEAAPDNPVILYREAAMICAANTKAIQIAKVTEQTPAPQGGAIDKTPRRETDGVFRDTAANLIWQAVPEPTEDELLAATAQACQKIFQAGITSLTGSSSPKTNFQ